MAKQFVGIFAQRDLYFRTRLYLLVHHRFSKSIAFASIGITYIVAIITVIIYFVPSIQALATSQLMLSLLIILVGIPAIFGLVLVALVICSMFLKGQEWFDRTFHYPKSGLVPIHTRVNNVEQKLQNLVTLKEFNTRMGNLEKRMEAIEANLVKLIGTNVKDETKKAKKDS